MGGGREGVGGGKEVAVGGKGDDTLEGVEVERTIPARTAETRDATSEGSVGVERLTENSTLPSGATEMRKRGEDIWGGGERGCGMCDEEVVGGTCWV